MLIIQYPFLMRSDFYNYWGNSSFAYIEICISNKTKAEINYLLFFPSVQWRNNVETPSDLDSTFLWYQDVTSVFITIIYLQIRGNTETCNCYWFVEEAAVIFLIFTFIYIFNSILNATLQYPQISYVSRPLLLKKEIPNSNLSTGIKLNS